MDENKDGLEPRESQREKHYQGRRVVESPWRRLWKECGFIIVTVVVMLVVLKVILQIAWVPSGSMENTLPTKSILLSWQLPYVFSDPIPERGEIVTFRSDELDKLLVKRVIGLPGDTVSFRDGYVYIAESPLFEITRNRGSPSPAGRASIRCPRDACSLWETIAPVPLMPAPGTNLLFP